MGLCECRYLWTFPFLNIRFGALIVDTGLGLLMLPTSAWFIE